MPKLKGIFMKNLEIKNDPHNVIICLHSKIFLKLYFTYLYEEHEVKLIATDI